MPILILLAVSCVSPPVVKEMKMENQRTIFALGSLHAKMFRDAQYTATDFYRAIIQFAPDVILVEARPQFPSAAEASIDGGMEQALVYAIAERLKAKVVPVDWFDESLLVEMQKPMAGDEEVRMNAELKPLNDAYIQHFGSSSMIVLNGLDIQNITRDIYRIYEKYDRTAATRRNEHIVGNIEGALSKFKSGRVLIVFGLDHKYFIDDFLRRKFPRESLYSMGDWFDSRRGAETPIVREITQKAKHNISESKKLLKDRLEKSFYPELYAKQLIDKYKFFDEYIALYDKAFP